MNNKAEVISQIQLLAQLCCDAEVDAVAAREFGTPDEVEAAEAVADKAQIDLLEYLEATL